jgi:sulfatase modifying factor 1
MKRREKTQLIWILLGLLTVAAASLAGRNYLSAGKVESVRDPAGHTNNSRLHNASGGHDGALEDAGEPPVIVDSRPPGPDPDGMIWIPAGEFSMGTQEPMFTDTRPIHRVALNGFWMDRTEVTNEQFSAFVRATGYVTVAERKPRAEDYPGVPPEKLVAGSIVFSPPKDAVPLNDYMQWWSYVGGADWRHPEGPKSDLEGREKHPVVHIAWEDANVFAKWAGKRLPTEAEFEWAARGGLDRKKYVWGDDFKPSGKFQANTFQGNFPNNNTGADGYLATAPVGSFEPNGFGLSDVAGNVWEWCSDWYRADYYQTVSSKGSVTRDPAGPADSSDPNEPGVPKRVTKGGSFLCTDQYCSRYMPGGRGKEAPDSGTNHLGFRLVKDLK